MIKAFCLYCFGGGLCVILTPNHSVLILHTTFLAGLNVLADPVHFCQANCSQCKNPRFSYENPGSAIEYENIIWFCCDVLPFSSITAMYNHLVLPEDLQRPCWLDFWIKFLFRVYLPDYGSCHPIDVQPLCLSLLLAISRRRWRGDCVTCPTTSHTVSILTYVARSLRRIRFYSLLFSVLIYWRK